MNDFETKKLNILKTFKSKIFLLSICFLSNLNSHFVYATHTSASATLEQAPIEQEKFGRFFISLTREGTGYAQSLSLASVYVLNKYLMPPTNECELMFKQDGRDSEFRLEPTEVQLTELGKQMGLFRETHPGMKTDLLMHLQAHGNGSCASIPSSEDWKPEYQGNCGYSWSCRLFDEKITDVDHLISLLEKTSSDRIVILLDSCFSGGLLEPQSKLKLDNFARTTGRQIAIITTETKYYPVSWGTLPDLLKKAFKALPKGATYRQWKNYLKWESAKHALLTPDHYVDPKHADSAGISYRGIDIQSYESPGFQLDNPWIDGQSLETPSIPTEEEIAEIRLKRSQALVRNAHEINSATKTTLFSRIFQAIGLQPSTDPRVVSMVRESPSPFLISLAKYYLLRNDIGGVQLEEYLQAVVDVIEQYGETPVITGEYEELKKDETNLPIRHFLKHRSPRIDTLMMGLMQSNQPLVSSIAIRYAQLAGIRIPSERMKFILKNRPSYGRQLVQGILVKDILNDSSFDPNFYIPELIELTREGTYFWGIKDLIISIMLNNLEIAPFKARLNEILETDSEPEERKAKIRESLRGPSK